MEIIIEGKKYATLAEAEAHFATATDVCVGNCPALTSLDCPVATEVDVGFCPALVITRS
jgi:hypothetical protein